MIPYKAYLFLKIPTIHLRQANLQWLYRRRFVSGVGELVASLTENFMEKQIINKNVDENDLVEIIKKLEELNVKLNQTALDIFENETKRKLLSKPSHLTFSIVHRAIELNRGFITLTEANNWITAINLLRLQADNCMRFFALGLVDDRLDFYNRIQNGEHIRNIRDAEGHKMTDLYLSQKLDSLYPGFRQLYENISGLIHFSNEHIKLNNEKIDNGNDFMMYIRIAETTEFSISKKVDYAFNMFLVGKELFGLLNGYKLSMAELMKRYD